MADISRITLPNGSTYNIKDSVARSMIAGGINFIIAWDGNSIPIEANIPKNVSIVYNNVAYFGTLEPSSDTVGSFYLVKSSSLPSGEVLDIYDEYTTITVDGTTPSYFWEKLGDTKIDLSNIVTNVTLNKDTDTVVGTNATFTVTQPTVKLSTGATAGSGVISVATGITSASASGDVVTALTGLGSPSTSQVVGKDATFTVTQPTIAMSLADSQSTGSANIVTNVTKTASNIKATATGANTAWNSKDAKTVVTGYANPTSANFLQGVTKTEKALVTTSVKGVTGTTNASKVTRTAQTTATGSGTASQALTDWLKGISVTDEVLTFGAATLNTQQTYHVSAVSDVTVPVADANATTVATGAVATSDTSGATVIVDVADGTKVSALTGLGSPSTASVVGASSTFKITQPTVNLSTGATAGTGVIEIVTDVSKTSKEISATASSGNVEWNNQKTVNAVTGYSAPTTDKVLGENSTITVTPTTTNIKATASGGNVDWNSKDSTTVLTDNTTITVTKGS